MLAASAVDAMLKKKDVPGVKVFYRNERRDDGPYESGVHEELVRREWVFDYGNGHMAYSGPVLALSRLIDSKAEALYRKHFSIIAAHYPAFIDAKLLARCGYFDSHPNAVSLVGHIIEDFDVIEDFRKANLNAETPVLPAKEHVHLPGLCLNPAACFPCYPTLEGKTVGSEGRSFSWQGRVFRYESRNAGGLQRLWEFNVRELVFVGSEDFVKDCRQRALPLMGEIAESLDLDCQIETATDPFFATVAAAKTFWQQALEVKNEIMLPIEPAPDGSARRIAGGSINIHGNFFGDRFNILTAGGDKAFTGCVGIGIERWVLAAFSQHGFDPKRWPEEVRSDIFG